MKKFLLISCLFINVISNAQNTWMQKTDFGGAGRECAVGFSIGNKGYIGTGYDSDSTMFKDFWEYDPITDTWTQKADFGGTGRFGAVGFSIGNRGYIGTGMDSIYGNLADFWEYVPATNTWNQKSNFPGTPRGWACGFSIGAKGYLGIGSDDFSTPVDFYEYDPATDTWTQKADFAGPGRYLGVGFSIGNKGYIGTGTDDNSICYNDFWEYDPFTDSWTQKANFGGIPRQGSVGFSIGSRGYIGYGEDFCGLMTGTDTDFWEYIPNLNAWKHRKSAISINAFWAWAVGFSIGDKGYFGTGCHTLSMSTELYEYDPDTVNSNCAANFSLAADSIPHTWIATNYSAGTNPLNYWWSWGDGNTSTGATPTHTYIAAGYYSICLAINDAVGCIDTFCYDAYLNRLSLNVPITVNVIDASTGLTEQLVFGNSLIISPNPTFGEISLTKNTNGNEQLYCEIMNMLGVKVFEITLNHFDNKLQTSLDISFLSKGIYLIRVGDGVHWENKQIVRE